MAKNGQAGWPNGKALDYESRDCRFDPCVGHQFQFHWEFFCSFFFFLSLFLCAAFGNVDLSYQLNRIWGLTMNDTTRNEFTGYVCITQCQLLIFI